MFNSLSGNRRVNVRGPGGCGGVNVGVGSGVLAGVFAGDGVVNGFSGGGSCCSHDICHIF